MLIIYIVGAFLLYCGIYNWHNFGYSDASLVFLIFGAYIFLAKPFIRLRNAIKSSSTPQHDNLHGINKPKDNVFASNAAYTALEKDYKELYSKYSKLVREYDSIKESYWRLMAARATDPEAEAKIQRLVSENNKLRGDLESSQAAAACLNRQLRELESKSE